MEGSWICGLLTLVLKNAGCCIIKYCFFSTYVFLLSSSSTILNTFLICVVCFFLYFPPFSLYTLSVYFPITYFKKKLFLRTVLGLQWNWEGTEIFHILLAPHMDNLLCYQHHSSEWYVLTIVYLMVHSGCCILDEFRQIYNGMYHYHIVQNI